MGCPPDVSGEAAVPVPEVCFDQTEGDEPPAAPEAPRYALAVESGFVAALAPLAVAQHFALVAADGLEGAPEALRCVQAAPGDFAVALVPSEAAQHSALVVEDELPVVPETPHSV